ncbi:RNA polymerase subunit sigma-70 [bacterium 1XD42-94]|nr:RNA polymerase subunit sigma-70 [bacterium 1XD42-76]NBK04075.1 RNA polymerase subunit sigma-70 [bacterium 1XD42-94]
MKTEDLFEVYLGELSGIEDCSVEENARLLAEIRAGSREARNRLIEGNLKRAMFFVQDYVNQGVPVSDLIQEASLELMLLADEGFEDAFEGLLESRIRVRMEEVIREQKADTDTKEEVLARVNVLQEVSKRMAEELGREASLGELSEWMQLPQDEVREIMKMTMDALGTV